MALPCAGQVPDPGTAGQYPPAEGPYTGAGNGGSGPVYHAQPADGPGAAQDAEAAREKLLKASDELDLIESNAEANKVTLEGMKSDITQLQSENAALKQQLAALQEQSATLQAALDRAEAARAKEREALIGEVADLLASKNVGGSRSLGHHHKSSEADTDAAESSTEVHGAPDHATDTGSEDEADHVKIAANDTGGGALAPPPDDSPPKPEKGYYHVVESGETLSMICSAYREQGVKVSVSQVMKANGLTSHSMLKVGQKLFIPKPGT